MISPSSSSSDTNLGFPLEIIKWNRKDRGDPNFWLPMQYELENFLFSWDFCYASDTLLPTDDYVNVFNQHINLALHNSLPNKGSRTAQQTSFFWDSILFKLHCHENQSFLAFKHANDADKSRHGDNQREPFEKLWQS